MIRLTALYLFTFALITYAWRDWYKSLCGLILLIGVSQHPDMPTNVLGIQGLNPWNLILLSVMLAWLSNRHREAGAWDFPPHAGLFLLLYFALMTVATIRMTLDWRAAGAEDTTFASVIGEYWINTFKWVLPGVLLFDGARTRPRVIMGLASLLGIYVILGIQVIKWMPPSSVLSESEITFRALKVLQKDVGWSRVNLSMLLGGASWAILATLPLAKRGLHRGLILFLTFAMVYAQALTGGRTGYATWAAVGLILGIVRWRRYLLLVPLVLVMVVWLVPGARGRMLQGVSVSGDSLLSEDEEPSAYEMTSGRNLIWPYVLEKIGEKPLFGWGREAMTRSGLHRFLLDELGESFPHPHNAYLQILFDGGWAGLACVLPFYAVVLFHGFRLFLDSRSPYFVAIGGVASALVLALLIASVGSQTFYPREGAVGMWCAFGLTFRLSVERARVARRSLARSAPSPLGLPIPSPHSTRMPTAAIH